jgi:hypothetical protein
MVPVNHKCTIIDMVLDIFLQLFKGQRQKGHYCKSVVEIYGDFLLFRYFGIKSVYEAPHVVNLLVKKLWDDISQIPHCIEVCVSFRQLSYQCI